MSVESEIREFLTSRRARVTPERAGLPKYGRQRRVAGLRREEVSLLAGISVEYYTRLERGNARGFSESVLEAISQALQLDEAERAHLLDLVRTANAGLPPRRNSTLQRVRPTIARIVDAMTGIPACVLNGRLDVLYANDLANALFSDVFRDPARPPNLARFAFLDPRSAALWVMPQLAGVRQGWRRNHRGGAVLLGRVAPSVCHPRQRVSELHSSQPPCPPAR